MFENSEDSRASAKRLYDLGNRMLSGGDYDMAFYCFHTSFRLYEQLGEIRLSEEASKLAESATRSLVSLSLVH